MAVATNIPTVSPDPKLRRVQEFFRHYTVRETWPWRQWSAHPLVAQAINRRLTGDAETTLLEALPNLLPRFGLRLPAARAASLGCGRGRFDRALYRHAIVQRLTGYDISPDSLQAATHCARAAAIPTLDYLQADLNTLTLPPATFDLIVVDMALHHTTALERLYDEIAAALKPGGLLLIDEYVGPTRFRWTERQMQAVNGLLAMLPPRHRVTPERNTKPFIQHLPESFFEQMDPSEAIRAADVVPCLAARFHIRWHRPYGGTILHPLLHDIAWTFGDGDPLSDSLLRAAIDLEDALIEAGDLAADFAVIIAAPK